MLKGLNQIVAPSRTPPPYRHKRTSTEFTILGKKIKSKYKLADYEPGKNSKPLQHAVKTILTILNNELNVRTKNFTEIYRIRSPDFSIAKAENISFISGNHKVGDVIPIDHSRNTLILTTWRSGSTFLGDLLNQYPGAEIKTGF